ncbi:MAG: argininosuccinate lyase [Candidatus Levyibacteriota bacterium]
MAQVKTQKLWGHAFDLQPEKIVIEFCAGRDVIGTLPADSFLLPYDVWGDKAHCIMLSKTGIISKEDAKIILKGLDEVEKQWKEGKFVLDPAKEDVHTNIESFLIENYGVDHAGKLHTARSRNDQINVDTRLYLRDQARNFTMEILSLTEDLLVAAKKYEEYLIPGFTHTQHAMITTFGHLCLFFANMVLRDANRFTLWYNLHNYNPLGSIVSYGTSFPIDRHLTSKLMAFDGPELNSIDELTNRWEAEADLGYAITILMNHLSVIAQTLILFATPQFGMIKVSDLYSTGSSIMPQKKNPDSLEVIRGKASVAAGYLQALLGIGKANFIGYNRDTQWTKYVITDLVRECILAPKIIEGVVETMQVNKEKMEYWCNMGFIGATSLLEQIASVYHVPFRLAKMIVERGVKYSKDRNKVDFAAIKKSLAELEVIIAITPEQVANWQDPLHIIEFTKSFGGPSFSANKQAVTLMRKEMAQLSSWLKKKEQQRVTSDKLLAQEIATIRK